MSEHRPEEAFNPADYLRTLSGRGGGQYLDVKWRKVWLHDMTKSGLDRAVGYSVDTEPFAITSEGAIFRATLSIFAEGGELIRRATGYGSETPGDFSDYIEKAETKAVGRAFETAGFGTAGAAEDGEAVADAPVQTGSNRITRASAPAGPRPLPAPANPDAITRPQQQKIKALMRALDLSGERAAALARGWVGVGSTTEMSRQQASTVIDRLENMEADLLAAVEEQEPLDAEVIEVDAADPDRWTR